jgi:predicted SAM-dependent methyltransferase
MSSEDAEHASKAKCDSTPLEEKEFVDFLTKHDRRDVPGTGIAKLVGQLIPQSLRHSARVVATIALSPFERLKAHRYARNSPSKLNLGCGSLPLPGWVNVDLIGLPVDVRWDICRPLPFDDNSMDVVFHEHVQEHVDAYHGFLLNKECYRVLKVGGICRIVMPDANKYIRSYLDPEHTFIKEWRGMQFTPMMSLVEEFYGFNHRAIYDYETLALYLRLAGFSHVESSQFGRSRINPCPDTEWRIKDSFYAEAIK